MANPLGKMSLRNAALKILEEKSKPMRESEIIAEVFKRDLIKSKGKTPINTLSALLNRLVKNGGVYKGKILVKKGKGLFLVKTKDT